MRNQKAGEFKLRMLDTKVSRLEKGFSGSNPYQTVLRRHTGIRYRRPSRAALLAWRSGRTSLGCSRS